VTWGEGNWKRQITGAELARVLDFMDRDRADRGWDILWDAGHNAGMIEILCELLDMANNGGPVAEPHLLTVTDLMASLARRISGVPVTAMVMLPDPTAEKAGAA
jgi:hypothetical protein